MVPAIRLKTRGQAESATTKDDLQHVKARHTVPGSDAAIAAELEEEEV